MKHFSFAANAWVIIFIFLITPSAVHAQNTPWPTLAQQLAEAKARPGTAFAALIAANQDFSLLRSDEASDKRGLPPWLRVYWRKAHPEAVYSRTDPTGGYPHVLKEILEWMQTHQDLKRGMGMQPDENENEKNNSQNRIDVSSELRISGLQTVPRSESDIRINFWDPTKIISASNNIGGTGRQAIYYSTNSGSTWSQTELPFTATDASHSDPTVDWTSDGKAWSSTMGIQGSTLKLRNYVSTDNGVTWTFDGTPSGSQTNVDKQMVWVDHSSTSPYFNQQYAIWHNGNPAFMNRRTAGAGGTWLATPIQVSGAESSGTCIGGDVKTNSFGDVFGFWPATGNNKIFVVKSTNGGASFSAPVLVATTFDSYDIGVPAFNSRRALIYVSGGAYRTAGKNIVYASWTDLSGAGGCTAPANEPGSNISSSCKTRIWFSRSIDGGSTWSAPMMINNQPGLNDQFNQGLAVDETSGIVGIMYYDTYNDGGRKKTEVFYQYSMDDGITWSTPEKITSSQTDETIGGSDSGNQYGDYNGLSAYANTIMPSWTDRRNNAKEEIWTAKTANTPVPNVIANGQTVTAGSCNGVSTLDPTETITVNFGLKNTGNANTGNITATLLSSGGVTSPSGPQNYGVLTAGGATVFMPYTFTLNGTCGGSVTATLSVSDGSYSTTVNYIFTLGTINQQTIFSENFDGVTAPALPAGWTTEQTGTTPPPLFTTTTSTPNSTPNAAFTNGVSTVASNSLVSPIINIPTTGTKTITFTHTYNFENTYDGSILEISTDGGSNYSDVTAVGGTFSSGGYTGALSTSFSNPLAGRSAWSGVQSTYATVTLSLPAAVGGASCKLRWRAGWDNSTANANPNWRIDNISVVLNNPVCSTCPEINITGNGVSIPDGNATTSLTNHTYFGSVFMPNSFARVYTIANLGSAPLNITSITETGANTSDFTVSGIATPTVIAAGNTKTFTVTFSPSASGTRNAVIHVNNDDADEADYDFAISGCGASLAVNLETNTANIATGINDMYSTTNACHLISRIETTSGAGQVSGNTTAKVWIESTQPNYNGVPYVKRHYEILPATNASTSSAKVTLYFTQAEFDAFNADAGSTLDLPANSADVTGKANLRIYKNTGASSDGSGYPYTYTGTAAIIDPADASIVWNAASNWWEVTFDVTGFGGFTVGTANTMNFCPGGSYTIPAGATGASYQWQVDNGNGFTNITDGANYSGTATAFLSLLNLPTNFYGYKYRCLVNGNPSTVYDTKFVTVWQGNISTAWNNNNNWASCSTVPDQFTDVIIPSGRVNYPILGSNWTVRTLRADAGALVTVQSGFILTITH